MTDYQPSDADVDAIAAKYAQDQHRRLTRPEMVMLLIERARQLNEAQDTIGRVLAVIEEAEDNTTDGHRLDQVSVVALRRALYPGAS